ncbi:hypothetical protein EV207_14926 [Scopulibacillus darangshiensis]|uniref:Uncharacterized protein n=1 Tax=Scopulibacillus darangshiensis TaxID=442528 RepID=A0A4R2NH63_9BACL|nr:hypothetical protein EV207_14926 [Scopulibacillus darangshiensis]
MGFILTFFSIWICSFLIARIFASIGGKWSLFGKTYWKNDLLITLAQSIIITIILVLFISQ